MSPPASQASASPAQEWVPVARLLRPQGRRGEVLAELLSDVPDLLRAGEQYSLAEADQLMPAVPRMEMLEAAWRPTGRNAGRIVLKLGGVDSIEAAEALAGFELRVPRSALPPPEADSYYVRDLLGSQLWDLNRPEGRQRVGEVADVQFATTPDGRQRLEDAAPLLVVALAGAPEGAEPVLVPLARAYLVGVNAAQKRVDMRLPDGLISSAAE